MANQPKKYKKFVATAATATLVASAIVPVASANEVKFSDVKDSSEYAPYIYDLAGKGVMTGDGDKFNPTREVSRAAAVKTIGKWLVNVHDFKVPTDYNTVARFNDLAVDAADQELVQYAALLKDLGIFTGNETGNLNAKNTLNREQMAKVVVEAYSKIEGKDITKLVADFESSLTDLSSVSASNVDYVKVFEKYGITTVNTFNPKGKIQRQHFAKFLSIAIESEELAKDTDGIGGSEPVYGSVEEQQTAVDTAVAALPAEVKRENLEDAQKAVDALKAAVKALEEAIAATTLSPEAKEAAEAKVAEGKAAEEAKQAEIDKVKEDSNIAVDAVNATSETTIEVTFAKDQKVTAEDLAGATLSLVNGETTLTATYLADSLANGKAVFALSGTDKLADATTYDVTGSFTNAQLTVSTIFGVGVAKDFTFITNGLTAVSGNAKVEIAAKDQYGKDYIFASSTSTIKVDVKVNGVPQVANTATLTNNEITINKALNENDVVELTITNTIDKDTQYTATKSYTVGKAVTLAPTTIAGIKFENVTNPETTSVVNGNTIKLTANVRDQNGNTIAANNGVTWVVEKGAVEGNSTTVGNATKEFTVAKAGELQITAYLANGQKYTYSTTVSATAISTVAVEAGDVTNNEEKAFEVTATPTTASITPNELSYEVTSVPTGVDKAAVKVTFAYGTTEATKNQVYANVTTPKNGDGNYTIKFSAAGKSVDKAFKSSKNTAVTQVTVDAIATNELQVGNEVVKAIKFFNKHGEELVVTDAPSTVKTAGLEDLKFYGAKADGTVDKTSPSPIKFVGITAKVEGNQSATIVSGTGTTTVSATAVAAGKVQTLTLGSAAASVIVDDSYDAKSKTDAVAVVNGKAYTLIPVSAVDNYGVAKDLVSADFTLPEVKGVEYKYFTGLENDKVATETDAVKYIGVHVDSEFGSAKTFNFEAKLAEGVVAKGFVAPKKTITVREARALKTISLAPTTASVVKGSKATYKVSGVDQYGIVSALTAEKLTGSFTGTANGIEVSKSVQASNDVTIDVTGNTSGDYALTFTYLVGATADPAKDLKLNASIKVAEADEAINSIEINKDVLVGKDKANADKLLQVAKDEATKITLTATAKDASNGKVEINQTKDVLYSVTSVDLKDASGKAVTDVKATFDGNVLTLSESEATYTGTVKVTATSVNGKTNTITLNVSNASSVAQAGTFYFTSTSSGLGTDGKALPALETITFTTADGKASNTVDVYLVAVDQYSNIIEVNVDKDPVFSNTRITGSKSGNKITLTAKAAGSTTLSVFNANNVLILSKTVTATQADVEATTLK